ncbi:1,4-dihydroxy-2-naphthoate octaprenyltransferase, partial [Tessaracoccus sp. OH4464_COT-324]|uniref:1,4-dihydroxy-2-naphthoate octaprenyltransferase n=1 Tax=Tessaracoccus sp. OH4464_COT-324 TaxID=2491059 RepID=UPI000F6434B3
AGKNTLVVRLGAENARIYHCILLATSALSYFIFTLYTFTHWANFLFILAFPLLMKHAYFVYQNKDPLNLRPILAQMSLLALLTNLLFSLGLLVN